MPGLGGALATSKQVGVLVAAELVVPGSGDTSARWNGACVPGSMTPPLAIGMRPVWGG